MEKKSRKFNIKTHLSDEELRLIWEYTKKMGVSIITKHIYDRGGRFCEINLDAEPVYGFGAVVDRGHIGGEEIHTLFTDGSYRIYNYKTRKLCTVFVPTQRQALRIKQNNDSSWIPTFIYEKLKKGGR